MRFQSLYPLMLLLPAFTIPRLLQGQTALSRQGRATAFRQEQTDNSPPGSALAIQQGQPAVPDTSFLPEQQTSELRELLLRYRADYGSLDRFYFMANAPERRERLKALAEDYLGRLETTDARNLGIDGRVDFVLFQKALQQQLHRLEQERGKYGQIADLIPFAAPLYRLEKQRRRGASLNGRETGALLDSIARGVQQASASLEAAGELNGLLANFTDETVKGLRDGLKSITEFYEGYHPGFTWWAAGPAKELDSLLERYSHLLKEKSDGRGQAIGRDELVRQLEYAFIPYTPEELIDIARSEFAWCDREMLKASREMGFGDDWKKALEKVKNTYVPAGEQPALIMRLYEETMDFLKEKDLVTIPPLAEETWRMIMMTPERQLINPFFTGGEVISISYPANTMSHADKLMSMRGNNPHFSRATVHHELIAGHHLQQFMNRRYKPYRQFNTPFWTEGWSLYWEMLLWDLGFPRSPEDRVGMLFWRMHRCARIIFSLNFHLGKWTPQECIDFLVKRVGHEYANAEGEVKRSFAGGYSPLYQLAYMIGGLQFYALKEELVGSGKMTYRQFHDAVLRENNIPVEMVRAILTGRPPGPDFGSSWRFYREDLQAQ